MKIENIKKINDDVKTFSFPKPSLKKNFEMEVQKMQAASVFGEYHGLMRTGAKRCHKLSGDYKGGYGVGLNHRYRTVVKPKPDVTGGESGFDRTSCQVLEICKDYH